MNKQITLNNETVESLKKLIFEIDFNEMLDFQDIDTELVVENYAAVVDIMRKVLNA